MVKKDLHFCRIDEVFLKRVRTVRQGKKICLSCLLLMQSREKACLFLAFYV